MSIHQDAFQGAGQGLRCAQLLLMRSLEKGPQPASPAPGIATPLKNPLTQPKFSDYFSDNWQSSTAAKAGRRGSQGFLNIVSSSHLHRHQTKTYSNSLGERATELELLQILSWLKAAPGHASASPTRRRTHTTPHREFHW